MTRCETRREKIRGDRLLPAGPTLFRTGRTFPIGLTPLSIVIVAIGCVARILWAVF